MSASDFAGRMMIELAENAVNTDVDASLQRVEAQYRSIRNSFFKVAERRMELLLYRLYDVKFYAARAGVEDTVRYVLDDEYFDAQQAQLKTVNDEEKSNALYEQAVLRVQAKDYAEAGRLFLEAAQYGHVAAQYNYGVSVANGEVGDADPLQACYWYWKAARGGSVKAKINLGIAYRSGTGVKADGDQMLYLYASAAVELEPTAVYNLGDALMHGSQEETQQVGRLLLLASIRLDDDACAAFVKDTAENLCTMLTETMPIITV